MIEIQREIALRIDDDKAYYIEIDNALDNLITEEIIWEKIKGKLILLQTKAKKMK